jgi:hypothetical protein
MLATVLLAAPAAESAASCRTDRLGNVVCRGASPAPALRLPKPLEPPAARNLPTYIPSWREDAFGTVRPQEPTVTGDNPFGEAPRPEPRAQCRTDSFGAVRCR